MKRLLLLTAIFLSGCAEVQQNIKNSIHLAYDYRNEYQPYSGDLDPNHLHQYSTICNQRSYDYKSNMIAREKAEFFRSDTVSYNCREGLGNDINCRASNNDAWEKLSWRSREGVRKDEWTSLTEKYHQSCMAEYGYKSVRVCFRNCEQPNQYEEKRTISPITGENKPTSF